VLAITQGGTKAKAMIAATIAVTNRVVLSNFIARTPMVVDLLDDDFGKQNSLSLWERVGVRVVFPRSDGSRVALVFGLDFVGTQVPAFDDFVPAARE
jgi:hypothetical protein